MTQSMTAVCNRRASLDVALYLVTNSTALGDDGLLRAVEQACAGGVTLVQLREKERSTREYYELAAKVKQVTDRYQVPLIIDDRADVACAVGAAGVHVGAADLPVAAARAIMGPDAIVGATAKTVEAALAAEAAGADYLGVGAMYPTKTKVVTVITPVETLAAIARSVSLPTVAIGGLDADNLGVLQGSGARGVAVVSAIMDATDARAAAVELRRAVARCLGC
jgi:thiamine-phosphate pyrophosphorylase